MEPMTLLIDDREFDTPLYADLHAKPIAKFNPNHDERGRFASAEGGVGTRERTNTPAFKAWFRNSKVVNRDGAPKVVYHGTTHEFTAFHPASSSSLLNPESAWGAGVYFTNSTDDLANYAGEGPDLTQRIELLAESLPNYDDDRQAALADARTQLSGFAPASMPVYLSMQTPFVVGQPNDGGPPETRLTTEFEYETPNDPNSDIVGETGTLPAFAEALRHEARNFDNTDHITDFIAELYDEGGEITASRLDKLWDKSESVMYVEDDAGKLAGRELLRASLQRAGFDGIIDNTVNTKFGSASGRGHPMAGMDEDTVHYVAFVPTQIKSALSNTGQYSLTQAHIGKDYDESLHPRDEKGMWTVTEGGAPLQLTGPPPTKGPSYMTGPATREAFEAPLRAAGVRIGNVDDLTDKTLRDLDVREHEVYTTDDVLAAQGVADGLMLAREDSTVLAAVKDHMREVPIVFMDLHTHGQMVTCLQNGKTVIIVNLLPEKMLRLHHFASDPTKKNTVATDIAAKVYKEKGMEAAIRAEHQASIWHEMGHVADVMSGRDYTDLVTSTLDDKFPGDYFGYKASRWAFTTISHYAATKSVEAAAELFVKVQARQRLPPTMKPVMDALLR